MFGKHVVPVKGYSDRDRRLPPMKFSAEYNKQKHLIEYDSYISRWKNGEESGLRGVESISAHIRRYLFIKFESKCCECGWCKVNATTNKVPLEVEHIDGNWKNNNESNLKLLCPNCHSLTSTYRSLNKGKGRKVRLQKIVDKSMEE